MKKKTNIKFQNTLEEHTIANNRSSITNQNNTAATLQNKSSHIYFGRLHNVIFSSSSSLAKRYGEGLGLIS